MSALDRFSKLGGGIALETVASLLLVLALYWLFMVFLNALFPSGTPLKEMLANRSEELPEKDGAGRRPEAALKSLVRDVRFRRGNSVAWGGRAGRDASLQQRCRADLRPLGAPPCPLPPATASPSGATRWCWSPV